MKRSNREPPTLTIKISKRKMTHAKAVSEELKRWRFYNGEDSTILAFCACVGLKMQGRDMDEILNPINKTPEIIQAQDSLK